MKKKNVSHLSETVRSPAIPQKKRFKLLLRLLRVLRREKKGTNKQGDRSD